MGCARSVVSRCRCSCRRSYALPADFEVGPDLKRLVDRWQLTTQELGYFHHKFQQLDRNGSQTIEFDEFFLFLHEERSPFQDIMFEFIGRAHVDEEGAAGELTFTKWMISIFTFAFATKEELTQQVFEAYDQDRHGYLTQDNLVNFISSIHKENPIFPADVVHSLNDLIEEKHRIEYDEWQRCILRFPMLMWPIVRTQHAVQEKLIGRALFKSLDLRSPDMEYENKYAEDLRKRWLKRRDSCRLFWCGFPCCRNAHSLKDETAERELGRQKRRRYWQERRKKAMADKVALDKLAAEEQLELEKDRRRDKLRKEKEDEEGYNTDEGENEFTEVEMDEYTDEIV